MNKNKTRLISFVMTVVMLVSVISASAFNAAAAPDAQTRTVMLYLVGSNLESKWGCGTWNLLQAMSAGYDENLDFIVMTGGAKTWRMESEYLDGADEVDCEYDQIWKVEGKRSGEEHGKMILVEPTGIEGYEKANMSDQTTLVAFIDYCYENYPADQYDLILWDHGGGFAYGFGRDENFTEPWLITMADMITAFGGTEMFKDGKKFEIIDFDACLMAGVEVAAVLAPYTDYLVVSADTEPGYGQEYSCWLNAVRENPGMNGFELGKQIVNGLKAYYDERSRDATLSVVDTKQFTERLLPELIALDKILISEAKNKGALNGRYNFYDELYSIAASFEYADGDYSLYDLGNLVGALSSPQSEMDNATSSQITALSNAYTEVARRILSILADNDGSGDDVVYAAESSVTYQAKDAYYVRGLDGEIMLPDENGYVIVDPTGFSIFFGDGDLYNVYYFDKAISAAIKVIDDPVTKEFLSNRILAASYYALTARIGQIISGLSVTKEGPVTWEEVQEAISADTDTYTSKGVPILYDLLARTDDDFDTADDVADHFGLIAAQQAGEAISAEKIHVKRLIGEDGYSSFYQLTLSGASAQSFMLAVSRAWLETGNYKSDEFDTILHDYYGDMTYEEVYPYGIGVYSADYEATLDYYGYYENYYENLSDLYRRMYSSDTSVWLVPRVESYCFVLTDSNGVDHPAELDYRDRSRTRAYVPIQVFYADGAYEDAYLAVSYSGSGWKVDGLSFSTIDERSYYPMDSEVFIGAKYTTTSAVGDYNDEVYLIPISQFCNTDVTKDSWGITVGWKRVVDVKEITSFESRYYVKDVYDFRANITAFFEAADNAALQGDVAYTIDCVELSVAEAVYNGEAQTPKITATLNGKELTEGKDYKVLYDGSSEPGEAKAAVIGIGDFYGARPVSYTIEPAKLLGDMDSNDKITSDDAVYLLRYTLFPDYYPVSDFADFDHNGKITSDDAVYLLRYTLFPDYYPLSRS